MGTGETGGPDASQGLAGPLGLVPAWLFGAYQTGLVVLDQGTEALGTNFRYYLPAVFSTLAASWIVGARKTPSQTGDAE